ncbi:MULTISPECIES: ABC transporter permease subunit [Arthrobacter]|uniref:ABC transporter permease subunit n=2 Tax=Arthrobacter TaxID=1663 RepID=A0ABU9KMG4_9MICC|nr:ABC transporter permease subunit [Arthrobacter sp. YJM1]MDP5227975.1 ABC transporter permease subunit [Arthrobacter sp. YJM1]
MWEIFTRGVVDSWRATLTWAVGLVAAAALYLPLFPSMVGNGQMQQMLNSLPSQLVKTLNYDQLGNGAGYTQSTLFGLLGFLLLSMATIAWGASAVGSDEESGILELTLAHGVTRVQLVAGRALAILARLFLLVLVMYCAVAVLNGPSQLSLNLGTVAGAALGYAGLMALSSAAALLGGALRGRRVHGLMLGAAVSVAGYVFNAVGRQSDSAKWLLNFSPYHWFFGANPFSNGVDWGACIGMWVGTIVLMALAAVVLRARDVGR